MSIAMHDRTPPVSSDDVNDVLARLSGLRLCRDSATNYVEWLLLDAERVIRNQRKQIRELRGDQ